MPWVVAAKSGQKCVKWHFMIPVWFLPGGCPPPPFPPPPLLWEVEAKTCCIHVWRIFLSTQLFWYEKEIYLFKDPEQCCGSGSKLNLCGSVFWICIRIHTVTVKIATKKPWLADNNSSSSELVYTVPTAVFKIKYFVLKWLVFKNSLNTFFFFNIYYVTVWNGSDLDPNRCPDPDTNWGKF